MNIKKIYKDWLTRQQSRRKAKREALLRVEAREIIQVREFNGEVYLAYRNTPLLRIDQVKADIPSMLTQVRATYVCYMEE